MSNWIELNKDTGQKILLRSDSVNHIEEIVIGDAQFTMVSGKGYSVYVKENYYDVISLMAEKGELIIK